jgi:hypothetical protein
VVSIAAFQAVDPGSIPGRRSFIICFFPFIDVASTQKLSKKAVNTFFIPGQICKVVPGSLSGFKAES